jgi:hypothetical protein
VCLLAKKKLSLLFFISNCFIVQVSNTRNTGTGNKNKAALDITKRLADIIVAHCEEANQDLG